VHYSKECKEEILCEFCNGMLNYFMHTYLWLNNTVCCHPYVGSLKNVIYSLGLTEYKKKLHESVTFTKYYIHTIYSGETPWLSKNV
jgi:hypothetical protein